MDGCYLIADAKLSTKKGLILTNSIQFTDMMGVTPSGYRFGLWMVALIRVLIELKEILPSHPFLQLLFKVPPISIGLVLRDQDVHRYDGNGPQSTYPLSKAIHTVIVFTSPPVLLASRAHSGKEKGNF